MKSNINPLLKEAFVFRPSDIPIKGIIATTSSYRHNEHTFLRYAEGTWIPDDGEPDLAFAKGVFAYGVFLPHSNNISWSWLDQELSRSFLPEYLHRHHTNGLILSCIITNLLRLFIEGLDITLSCLKTIM